MIQNQELPSLSLRSYTMNIMVFKQLYFYYDLAILDQSVEGLNVANGGVDNFIFGTRK